MKYECVGSFFCFIRVWMTEMKGRVHIGVDFGLQNLSLQCPLLKRSIHVSAVCQKKRAGKYKRTIKGDKPLTYEMAYPPHCIAHLKSWNSWNTSNLLDGLRPAETLAEDVFIRKFLFGTWHRLFLSEVIIKRQANIIRLAGIVIQSIPPRKIYFLIGYTEELLSYWLQCPVKMELQFVPNREAVTFKYI